jgi:hypothetical protein
VQVAAGNGDYEIVIPDELMKQDSGNVAQDELAHTISIQLDRRASASINLDQWITW